MLKFSPALVAAPGVLLTLATANAQTFPSSLPIAVSCYVQQDRSWRLAYLYRVHANGDAIYITPDGKLTVTVNSKGIVEIPTNRPMGTDCYGKTLDELRASGRVMDFQRAR